MKRRKPIPKSQSSRSTAETTTAVKAGSFRTLGAFVLAAILLLAFFVGFAAGCKSRSEEITPPPQTIPPHRSRSRSTRTKT